MPHLIGANGATWAMVACGLLLIYGLPRLTTLVPSPLICIVVLTLVAHWLQLPLKTVVIWGGYEDSLPYSAWPAVRFSTATLKLIALPTLAIAMVGLTPNR